MTDHVEWTLSAQASAQAGLQDRLEAFADQHAVPAAVLHSVQLALEEHLTNVRTHGYPAEGPRDIRVRVALRDGGLQVEVADDARPFNPLNQLPPDLTLPADERPLGGLGIHMMREALDEITYRREDGRNILRMIKRLPAAREDRPTGAGRDSEHRTSNAQHRTSNGRGTGDPAR